MGDEGPLPEGDNLGGLFKALSTLSTKNLELLIHWDHLLSALVFLWQSVTPGSPS
jgi:hypothetical protein